MSRQSSSGKCGLCGRTFSKSAMTRHLRVCNQPQASAGSSVQPGRRTTNAFHLVVEGRYAKEYWLHIAVPVEAPLSRLDSYLRRIWLECCRHLSAFSIGDHRYSVQPMREYGEKGMGVALNRVADVGAKFSYEYDFGSTTELVLKVVAVREVSGSKREVQLLARNDPPRILCDECGGEKLAAQVCTECEWSGGGWLCQECAGAHKCGPDMLLPVVNSPRVGVCGYTG